MPADTHPQAATASPLRDGITIYFVRHGETDWNREARFQGQTDTPMNAKGRVQAQRNAETLAGHLQNPANLDYIASPLARTRETMEIIRTALHLDPKDYRTDDRLKEVSYGHWEGSLLSELPNIDPAGVAARARDPFHWRPNGGESYADLMVRTNDWLSSLTRDCVVVSHGGVSRTLRGGLYGIEGRELTLIEVPQDKILVLKRNEMCWL
jgi:broad specificity phosphatase PhoE